MKTLVKYLKKREAAIDALLQRPAPKYTAGSFHRLRVEIKKLHALFDLVNFCEKHFKRKSTFEPFRLIFRQAGKIRELQLEEAVLKKYLADYSRSGYRNSIRKQRLKEQKIFFSMLDKHAAARQKKRVGKTIPFLGKVSNKEANKYLDKKKKRVKKMLAEKSLDEQQVHELRQRMKTLGYNMKSLLPENSDRPANKNDRLSGLLGKWHDRQVMIGHLEKAIGNDGMSPGEISHLEKIKVELLSENEILLSEINAAIPRYLNTL